MIIEKIDVQNFRCIKQESIMFDGITALLGRNGCGKSSFLKAIDLFYDVSAKISIEDFFNRFDSDPILVRITFSKLREDEKKEFESFIREGRLIVTKKISKENGIYTQKYYSATMQIHEFAEIRSLNGKTEIKNAWNTLVEDPGEFGDLGGTAKSADIAEQLMQNYEKKHPELLTPIEKEKQFFGSKNIGGGKLDNHTKFVLIPAVKEVTDEFSNKKGAISQLLDAIVIRQIEARDDIREFKKKINEEAKKIYCTDNLKELPALGDSISKTLGLFSPGAKLRLDWQEFEMPDIEVPSPAAKLIEDNFEGDIGKKGHGLQRALIFTLLQYLAMMKPEIAVPEDDDGVGENGEEENIGVHLGPDLILAIEEPELYLHPSRCRYMRELLYQLIGTNGKGLGERNQVVYTTHSPLLLDIDNFEKVRIIRKISSVENPVSHSKVTTYTFKQLAEQLATISDIKTEDITEDSLKARLTPVMNSIVNEGFFADVVVVVEGDTELGILWKLQEILKKDWSRFGITVIPAGGKNKIGHPTLIFRGFEIPTYFVFDGDVHNKDNKDKKKEKDSIDRNKRNLSLAYTKIVDFPTSQVGNTWAVFEDTIETYIRKELTDKVFGEISEIVTDELGYKSPSDLMKNIDGSARFIELVYKSGQKLPFIEDIIEKITLLYKG